MSGREPDWRFFEAIQKVRSIVYFLLPLSELEPVRLSVKEAIGDFIRSERDSDLDLDGQMKWYGALNSVSATCNQDCEKAAEYAAREARREARRFGDERSEIKWQKAYLAKLNQR